MGDQLDQDGPDANGAGDGPTGGPVGGPKNGAGGHGPYGDMAVDGLIPKQEQAIIALLNQPTFKHAAESIGVGERTIHTWLKQPAFKRAYRTARRESYAHAVSLCQHYAVHAIKTLVTIMNDPSSGAAARVAAAQSVLKFGREGIELDDLAERIEALETAAAAAKPLGLAS